MIRFVDIKTGNTFDGGYPYKFWFDALGINLMYSKPICFISNNREATICIEKTEIFHLIDPNKLVNNYKVDNIYGFEYHDINDLIANESEIKSVGTPHNNYYVHIFYILMSAKQSGEYLSSFTINEGGEECGFEFGAEFYGENEQLYINLANNGIEIPESIQKALYCTNVHEDKRDNITLNRKWKELLSNFWDVMANRGSYLSLFNSLKWFEYGDLVKLCEIWKIKDGPFTSNDVKSILSAKYYDELNGFAKTTYFGLYCALEQPKKKNGAIVYDKEKNPELERISLKWSTQDLSLKLCLLGHFYKTYFMPIHLDLIHSTIEDIVYTNTFKIKQGTKENRSDIISYCRDLKCNVNDGDVFRLDKVQCQVGPKTMFGAPYDSKDMIMVGVQRELVSELGTNEDWQQFASQLYNELGAIVDFELEIPLLSGDKIKRSVIIFNTLKNGERKQKSVQDFKLLDKVIRFSLLCPEEGEYSICLQFDTERGEIFTKYVRFSVIDTTHTSMKVYKIQNKIMLSEDMLHNPSQLNDYVFARRIGTTRQAQFIPGNILQDADPIHKRCVYLSHMLILTSQQTTLSNNYFELVRETGDDKSKRYYIYISKTFKKDISKVTYNGIKSSIYREDYIFIPEFHEMIELNGKIGVKESINDYTITDNDTLCIVPGISYGKYISEYDWVFTNISKPMMQPYKFNLISEPFVSGNNSKLLEPGYYNVEFNYRLTNEEKINTVSLNSAFRKI